MKKSGEFDVVTDAPPDREKSVVKQKDLLAAAREYMVKALPGKNFFSTIKELDEYLDAQIRRLK